MTKTTYQTIFNPSEEDRAPIDQGFHNFNLSHLDKEMLDHYFHVLVSAKDENGQVVSGLYGQMFWDWLQIYTLWVEEYSSGRGIGANLLTKIETIALQNDFTGSHLETIDFQALDFYQEHGDEVFGELEGKPAGSIWFYLKKKFTKE